MIRSLAASVEQADAASRCKRKPPGARAEGLGFGTRRESRQEDVDVIS
jgi:hypothetical protein